MATAKVELPPKLIPVFTGQADVRGAYGGRGSGKSRSFAKMTAVRAYMWGKAGRRGIILCARQFMNSLSDSSLEEIKAAINSEPWLAEYFEIGEKFIRTIDGAINYAFTGLDRNINSVKGKSRVLLCWVDEAEPVTDEAWIKLDPTLREDDSELWVTWNPERKGSATDKRYRNTKNPRAKIVELNWRDNPWFPAILDRKRLNTKAEQPEQYEHIWEGDYKMVVEGAYYAKHLIEAKHEGRICFVPVDPLMTIRLIADIGGTGKKSDSFVFWAAQFVNKEIRWLNYYEAQGQSIDAHLAWCNKNKYTPDRAKIWLPHDGASNDKVYDVSYESALTKAGYSVTVVPNQGTGAAISRIEAARLLFPRMLFNEATTQAGRDAIGFYHEKIDENRAVGLGPEHDWASHGADAFGLGAVIYEEPRNSLRPDPRNGGVGGWMG